ncbi:TM2 domain-containing protein 3 [Tritrichomonas musculus]|uniref:TM2 domain-containing protein 3 n=1 Tax=Tritrichomonas musculus TaxID=1915356 RepID=A0ABR2KTZ9_9EUKA
MCFFINLIIFTKSRNCSEYWPDHFVCESSNCNISYNITANCSVPSSFACDGERYTLKVIPCIYCWQLPKSSLRCSFRSQCKPNPRPQPGTCTVLPKVSCLGTRTFGMQQYCTTNSGYSLLIAISLSLFFGGFGADRFYLGYTTIGLLKLISLGGFGIWSIVDLILLFSGVMKPADGSIFEELVEGYL